MGPSALGRTGAGLIADNRCGLLWTATTGLSALGHNRQDAAQLAVGHTRRRDLWLSQGVSFNEDDPMMA